MIVTCLSACGEEILGVREDVPEQSRRRRLLYKQESNFE